MGCGGQEEPHQTWRDAHARNELEKGGGKLRALKFHEDAVTVLARWAGSRMKLGSLDDAHSALRHDLMGPAASPKALGLGVLVAELQGLYRLVHHAV